MNFSGIEFHLRNMHKGIHLIRRSTFEQKVWKYILQYQNKNIKYKSNIRVRVDYALRSLCRDKVLEEYLHSKKYHIDNIGVFVNPFRYAPKAAVLLLYSPDAVAIDISVKSGQNNTVYKDVSSTKKYHRISITGLEEGDNHISLSLMDMNQKVICEREFDLYIPGGQTMDPYPIVKTENMTDSAYPHILITGGDLTPFVFNTNGSLMHFIRFKNFRTSTYGVYPFKRHKYLWPLRNIGAPSFANPHSCLLYEMDYMGRINRTYHIKHGIHHYVLEMPNGNLLTCSSSGEHYSTLKEGHTEDILVEIERETGNIVRKVYLKDLFGDKFIDQVDWVHANYLEYNQEEDSLTICMRNIHSVIKINWTTLEVQWLLSLPELWNDTKLKDKLLLPQGKVDYSFQAHAAYEVTDYKYAKEGYRYYLIFDNHRLNRRPIKGYKEDGYSYINIYAIDEKDMTVTQEKHFQIDLSIVRSNARYDGDSNRLFNMSGCMARENEEFRGKIEEYDYDSGALLNRWCILEDFFSAYQFEWKSDDYCAPYVIDEQYQYVCGDADELSLSKELMPIAEMKADLVCFDKPFLEEYFMYFYTKDHSIDKLVFVGKNGAYERDYTDTWQTYRIHMERTYYCVVSLANLPADKYTIMIQKDGKLYNTSYYINITKPMVL